MSSRDRLRKNRTNVRMLATSWGLRLLNAIAPAAAERVVWRLFSTPRRPHPARPPVSDGDGGVRLSVESPSGRPLAVWSWGEGRPVLLAHGWSGHAGQMSAFIAPLRAAGFRVIAFDQPAHGQSAGKRTHMLEFRQAILAVADAVGPLAGIVAHSLGGSAAVLAMDRGLQVERLVLLAAPLDPPQFVQDFARHLGLPPDRVQAIRQRIGAWVAADLGGRDLPAVARSQTTAALIIHDEGDRAVAPADGQALAELWPGARLLRVTGHGHNRLLAAPEIVAASAGFISDRGAPTKAQLRTAAPAERTSAS